MRPFAPLALAALLIAAPALAQVFPPRPDDQVVLELRAEDWAETRTATVHAAVEAAFSGAQSAGVREQVLAALARTAPETKWHLTRFDQVRDAAGLDRWRIAAEARVEESKLAGLRDRAEQASKPGLKVTVDHVDFTPTLAERQATLAALRERVYRDAKAELDRLNALYAPRKYRIASVDFQPHRATPQPRMDRMERMATAAQAPAPMADAPEIAQRLTVQAVVVLRAEPPRE